MARLNYLIIVFIVLVAVNEAKEDLDHLRIKRVSLFPYCLEDLIALL